MRSVIPAGKVRGRREKGGRCQTISSSNTSLREPPSSERLSSEWTPVRPKGQLPRRWGSRRGPQRPLMPPPARPTDAFKEGFNGANQVPQGQIPVRDQAFHLCRSIVGEGGRASGREGGREEGENRQGRKGGKGNKPSEESRGARGGRRPDETRRGGWHPCSRFERLGRC